MFLGPITVGMRISLQKLFAEWNSFEAIGFTSGFTLNNFCSWKIEIEFYNSKPFVTVQDIVIQNSNMKIISLHLSIGQFDMPLLQIFMKLMRSYCHLSQTSPTNNPNNLAVFSFSCKFSINRVRQFEF